ncbi:uncharacterized protein [Palaemon carinicauda]|uniref:uncharacterized protein n=1 Tax=Palaemon carinicauda TaxID=392227 RepID=UPI0035B67473
MDEFDKVVEEAAKRKLQAKYRRRTTGEEKAKIEPEWITNEIREEIKKRKKLNREKRCLTGAERERAFLLYKQQKERTQLKGKKEKEEEIQLYDENGEKLSKEVAEEQIDRFWGENIYKMHENKMKEVWNSEERQSYIEKLKEIEKEENSLGHSFPIEIREHMDMISPITRKITPMNTPKLTEDKVKKILRKLKNKKAAGPDELKPELYKTIANDSKCLEIITKCLQNETKEKNKPEKWKK